MGQISSVGWVQRSFALHKLKRSQEAFDRLLPAAAQFPKEWVIPYNLACYCAQLGQPDESKVWFEKSMAIDGKAPAKAAVDDPDLKPLWDSMGASLWKRSLRECAMLSCGVPRVCTWAMRLLKPPVREQVPPVIARRKILQGLMVTSSECSNHRREEAKAQ